MKECFMEEKKNNTDDIAWSDSLALRYRQDFPILERKVHGKDLVYLDNSATSQKPQVVLDALNKYYTHTNANVHRGIHALSEEATAGYESARHQVAVFVNVPTRTLIFVRNTTEAINLVASAWGRKNLKAGDEILLSVMEHHSNIVPWQILAKEKGVVLRYADICNDGSLDMASFKEQLNEKTRLVSITHMSNVLGTINPIKEITKLAHQNGSLIFVDGAQSVPHMQVDITDLDCDFYAFSGHKMCGPTGIGGLYGREEILENMDPYMGGGSMINEVRLDGFSCSEIPEKFEAGTPNIAHAIVFGVVTEYLTNIGMANLYLQEKALTKYLVKRLNEIEDLTIYGNATARGGAVAFNINSIHPSDLSTLLDQQGVAIRAGHHCAQPLMRRLGIACGASARASVYLYNTSEEINVMIDAINIGRKLLVN
tara:strand:- start:157837 stop:159117 length:1281 start_codon:yes stop_codon:yes gene_type:complete